MARTTVPLVTIRTTSDGGGYPHGVVAGMGTSPFQALADLKKRAQAAAEQIVAASADAGSVDRELEPEEPEDDLPPVSLDFEVVGVLLGSGLLEDGYPGWCAYGTLTTPDHGRDHY
jgi:hypothetical protein